MTRLGPRKMVGPDHWRARRATALLRDALGRQLPDAQERRVRRLIARKDEVQYGVAMLTRQRAQELITEVATFVEWADSLLP